MHFTAESTLKPVRLRYLWLRTRNINYRTKCGSGRAIPTQIWQIHPRESVKVALASQSIFDIIICLIIPVLDTVIRNGVGERWRGCLGEEGMCGWPGIIAIVAVTFSGDTREKGLRPPIR